MAGEVPTPEEFATWLEPRQALSMVTKDVGTAAIAISKLADRLGAGIIRAYAGTLIIRAMREEKKRTQIVPVPPAWWREQHVHGHTLWQSGDATYSTHALGYEEKIIYLDIRFDPVAVAALLPKPKPAPPVPVPTPAASLPSQQVSFPTPKNAGGRPRKEFWDDMLIAVIKRLYWEGEAPPKTQADVERAMLEWAVANSHNISETSVKVPARKIFKTFNP